MCVFQSLGMFHTLLKDSHIELSVWGHDDLSMRNQKSVGHNHVL